MPALRPRAEPRVDLEPLLYRIHAASDADADWRGVLQLLRERLAGRLATLWRHHFASGEGAVLCEFPETARFRTDYPRYASRNPWLLSSEEFAPGSVMTGDELLSNRELLKTDFYRELLQPYDLLHCLSGVAVRRGSLVYCVNVHRSHGDAPFGGRDKAELRTVLAHLSLALENRWRLRQAGDMESVLTGIVDRRPQPSLLVDREGRIVHCNRSATALSALRTGLCVDGGRLAAATALDRAVLRDAIRQVAGAAKGDAAGAARAVTLSVPGAALPAIVSVHTAGGVFRPETGDLEELVWVSATNPHLDHDFRTCTFVKQFRLSPAQARMSVLIVTGHRLADAAHRLHVSENTARSHLKQVFQKTNTHGQLELVHLHARCCIGSE
ncbi:MAG: helix-turn-helix transcriptional regulator [Betaproteobacteria bacterium]|nr:helix-turn-helix transcriptional regulator [Betaproteobacteria bacterium]